MAIAQRYTVKDGEIKFMGRVKRANKFKANPTVDHIMENLACDPSDKSDHPQQQKKVETSGMVTLRIPSDPNSPNGMRPLDINLNGQNYSLPRDVPATVPKEIADIVLNAQSSISSVPAAQGEKVVCQVDPESMAYLPGKGLSQQENRRFNVIVEDMEE